MLADSTAAHFLHVLRCRLGLILALRSKVVQNLANKGTPGSQLDVFESLQLGTMCGQAPPEIQTHRLSTPTGAVLSDADRARSVFVAATGVVSGDAFSTVHAALTALRQSGAPRIPSYCRLVCTS